MSDYEKYSLLIEVIGTVCTLATVIIALYFSLKDNISTIVCSYYSKYLIENDDCYLRHHVIRIFNKSNSPVTIMECGIQLNENKNMILSSTDCNKTAFYKFESTLPLFINPRGVAEFCYNENTLKQIYEFEDIDMENSIKFFIKTANKNYLVDTKIKAKDLF